MKPESLRFLFWVLIALAAVTTIQKALGLSAPPPEQEAPKSLVLSGYRIANLPSLPGKRGEALSSGMIRRFRLHHQASGAASTLTLMPIRARGKGTLQLAHAAALEPRFSLEQRRLLLQRSPLATVTRPTDQLAIGYGPRRQGQGPQLTRLQTCLVSSGKAGVTAEVLNGEFKRQAKQDLAKRPIRTFLMRYLGPQTHNNWECLAIQLETEVGSASERDLLTTASALVESLQP